MEDTEGLTWRKSSFSGNGGPDCVEIAYDPHGHAAGKIRDSKSPERGHLAITPEAWRAFLADVRVSTHM
jgi:hypothetical protein